MEEPDNLLERSKMVKKQFLETQAKFQKSLEHSNKVISDHFGGAISSTSTSSITEDITRTDSSPESDMPSTKPGPRTRTDLSPESDMSSAKLGPSKAKLHTSSLEPGPSLSKVGLQISSAQPGPASSKIGLQTSYGKTGSWSSKFGSPLCSTNKSLAVMVDRKPSRQDSKDISEEERKKQFFARIMENEPSTTKSKKVFKLVNKTSEMSENIHEAKEKTPRVIMEDIPCSDERDVASEVNVTVPRTPPRPTGKGSARLALSPITNTRKKMAEEDLSSYTKRRSRSELLSPSQIVLRKGSIEEWMEKERLEKEGTVSSSIDHSPSPLDKKSSQETAVLKSSQKSSDSPMSVEYLGEFPYVYHAAQDYLNPGGRYADFEETTYSPGSDPVRSTSGTEAAETTHQSIYSESIKSSDSNSSPVVSKRDVVRLHQDMERHSAVSYLSSPDVPRETVKGDRVNLFSPVPELSEEDSPSSQEAMSPPIPIKEIQVLKPKEGNLYPNLDEADVSAETSLLSAESSLNYDESEYTRDLPNFRETTYVEDAHTPLHRSISAYRREQRTMQASGSSGGDNVHIEVATSSDESKDDAYDKKRKRVLMNNLVLKNQFTQLKAALNSAANSKYKGAIEDLEAQSLTFFVQKQIGTHEGELVRLNMEHSVRPHTDEYYDEGTLIISNLNIQLDASKMDTHTYSYYAFALISVGSITMLKTPVIPLNSSTFKNDLQSFSLTSSNIKLTASEVYSDFNAKVQVYAARLPRVTDTPSKKQKMTPKKKKATTPTRSSPRDGWYDKFQFQLMAYAVFSIKQLNQTAFSITESPGNYLPWNQGKPLLMEFSFQGKKNLIFRAMVNYYTDKAIELRHCTLDGFYLHLYRYPNDEGIREPWKSFGLKEFTSLASPATQEVSIVPHSFMFSVKTADGQSRNQVLIAGNRVQMNEWIRAINFYLGCMKVNKEAVSTVTSASLSAKERSLKFE